ncbi:MAG: fumarate reductase cytochrome b subunit [Helicobacteraceae bacterium]|jgi:fumarate reductase subunit C|nr:fumarate reductase cytochrome b subunit [Helicobacteraceae bacterium]
MRKLRKINKLPARLDFIQSATGVVLALFISGHILFESSILISNDAMYTMTQFFEGYYFFGENYPSIISVLALTILAIIVVHALVALRKFPSNYKQYKIMKEHTVRMNHHDTSLWVVQVITGFAMFFLASVHLYTMISQPDMIGPYASSERMVTEMMWPLYLLLLFAVVIHAGIGVYRLILKWGLFEADQQKFMKQRRALLRMIMYFVVTLYLTVGVFSLLRYMSIGYEHDFESGARYHPQGVTK